MTSSSVLIRSTTNSPYRDQRSAHAQHKAASLSERTASSVHEEHARREPAAGGQLATVGPVGTAENRLT
jgi:hypothetical protein